mgnify:FL=1
MKLCKARWSRQKNYPNELSRGKVWLAVIDMPDVYDVYLWWVSKMCNGDELLIDLSWMSLSRNAKRTKFGLSSEGWVRAVLRKSYNSYRELGWWRYLGSTYGYTVQIGVLERGKPWTWRYNCQRSVLREMII